MAKTDIRVITCFDGKAEAAEVFADIFALHMAKRGERTALQNNEKGGKNADEKIDENAKIMVESEQDREYNKHEVRYLNRAPRLYGEENG